MKNKKKLFVIVSSVLVLGLFSFQSDFFEIAKQIEIYNNLFKELNINYIHAINPGEITDKAIKNTLENLDPYTNFYNEQDVETARIQREGEYGGIGIATFYTKEGIVVAEVYKNYPADKAGLKAGDVITNIDNQELKKFEKSDFSHLLTGVPNTSKKITIRRNNTIIKKSITLDKITVNPVPFYGMVNENTGYIVLTKFTSLKASEEVKKAFLALEKEGMQQLVFDLRSNPGGSLLDAINITNFFIPKNLKVVSTKGKRKTYNKIYKTTKEPLNTNIPIVVLIDDKSASASEIVSGALQDYDRAVIMGKRSFGKGLVQRYFNLSYGTQMKITISKYYTPSGRCIQELDYENRDSKTGKVPKFSEGTINSFTTKNGRKVYDGGGVTPDISMDFSKKTEATKTLLKSNAIFNFVTNFTYNNPNINIDNYKFTTNDFNTFTNYLSKKDTSFVSNEEKLFKKAYKATKTTTKITNAYTSILNNIKDQKIKNISKNKDIISSKIQDEIIKRYAYKKGMYVRKLKEDKTIEKAVSLLNNPKKYKEILSK